MVDYECIVNLSIEELESELKSVKNQIKDVDKILYGPDFEKQLAYMTRRESNKFTNELTDKRYRLVKYRDEIEHTYRKKKLEQNKNFNQSVLKFGAYTDVHTPKIKPSGKGYFSAIKGISL